MFNPKDLETLPLSELLQNREVFSVFDDEFHKNGWLDVTALLGSDSTIKDLYADDTVPAEVLDAIVSKIIK